MEPNPNQGRPVVKCATCDRLATFSGCALCDVCLDLFNAGEIQLASRHLEWCTYWNREDLLIYKELQRHMEESFQAYDEHIAVCEVCNELGLNCCPDLDRLDTKMSWACREFDLWGDIMGSALYCC